MKLVLIDNNDSFTYNIVDLLQTFENVDFTVVNSFRLPTEYLNEYDKVIISPGPCRPKDFPTLNEVIAYCVNRRKDLLGICLGHQAICEYFGGKLIQMDNVVHGQKKEVNIDNHSIIYSNLPSKIEVGLYHSWVIDHHTLPDCLRITGMTIDNKLMSIEHKDYKIFGIQFHPESFMTERGRQIIENFLIMQ